MLFFTTERKIRKRILDRQVNTSNYIAENADPEKVLAETIENLEKEIEKRKQLRLAALAESTKK